MASMQYTLFVGDLSIFCTEEDLREAFEEYGELSEVKIIRCEETKKNLSYGFVKYVETEAAVRAIEELNGSLLCGRPLRIGWASRRNKADQMMYPPFSQSLERSSVHVTYNSNQIDNIVTEAYFVSIFSKYGTVIDAAVKRFEINEESRCQKGYGFVHFAYTPEGVAAAVKCCDELHNHTLDRVQYKCSISHRLRQCMNGGVSDHGHEQDQESVQAETYGYGYPPPQMLYNPFPNTTGYPLSYGYNAAGMLVPMGVTLDSQYGPYFNQMYPQQPGQAAAGVLSNPYTMPYPQYPMVNMQYAPMHGQGYYNDQAPAGVYTMPFQGYTWGYPQYTGAEEVPQVPQVPVNTPTTAQVTQGAGVNPYVSHAQAQAQAQYSAQFQGQAPTQGHPQQSQSAQGHTQTQPQRQPTHQPAQPQQQQQQHASVQVPIYSTLSTYNDHPHGAALPPAATNTYPSNSNPTHTSNGTSHATHPTTNTHSDHSDTTTNSSTSSPPVVTGFGIMQRPTASAMAAAVHGDAPFIYSPYGGTPAYLQHIQAQPQNGSAAAATVQTPSVLHNTQAVYPQLQQSNQPVQHHAQGYRTPSPSGLVTIAPDSNAARTKTWVDLFHSAASTSNGNNNLQAVMAKPVPKTAPQVFQVVHPQMAQGQQHYQHKPHPQVHTQARTQAKSLPPHHQHTHAHKDPRSGQRPPMVKSTSSGSTSSASTSSSSDNDYQARREAAMMVIGTGPSTGQSILVSSLRPRRDKVPYRNVNLSAVVPRQRGPSNTPRSAKLADARDGRVSGEGIASGVVRDTQAARNGTGQPRSPKRSREARGTQHSPQHSPHHRSVSSLSSAGQSSSPTLSLSPSTHEDTALDSAPVVSPTRGV